MRLNSDVDVSGYTVAPWRMGLAFGLKFIDYAVINFSSFSKFSSELAQAKSPGDLGEAWVSYVRRQFESITTEMEEVSDAVTEQAAPDTNDERAALGD
jgi:hypothetical protein